MKLEGWTIGSIKAVYRVMTSPLLGRDDVMARSWHLGPGRPVFINRSKRLLNKFFYIQ
jgi:hypothetical protein